MRADWQRWLTTLVAMVTAPAVGVVAPSPASAADGAAYFESVPAASPGSPYVAYVGDVYTVMVGTADPDNWETCRIEYGDGVSEAGNRRGPSCVQGKTWSETGSRRVTATLTDSSGEASTTSVDVDVRERPSAGEVRGAEGAPVRVEAPDTMDGSPVTWSMADASSPCEFDDATADATDVRCAADGDHEAHVTSEEGMSARVLVRVTNAAPSAGRVKVTEYRGPKKSERAVSRTKTGQALTILARGTDPGADDELSCRTDFGDGTVLEDSDGVRGPVRCGGPHSYTRAGRYPVTITVTDEDGAATTVTRTVRVDHRAARASVDNRLGGARVVSNVRLRRDAAPAGAFRLRLPNGALVVGKRPTLVETWKQPSGQVRREMSWEGVASKAGKKGFRYRVDLGVDRRGKVVRERVSVFSARRLVFHEVGTPKAGTARVKIG